MKHNFLCSMKLFKTKNRSWLKKIYVRFTGAHFLKGIKCMTMMKYLHFCQYMFAFYLESPHAVSRKKKNYISFFFDSTRNSPHWFLKSFFWVFLGLSLCMYLLPLFILLNLPHLSLSLFEKTFFSCSANNQRSFTSSDIFPIPVPAAQCPLFQGKKYNKIY